MSFKGFQKSVIRAPQTIKQRFNLGENTKDAFFIDSERRFQELEIETKKLHDESKKYSDAINGMLNHQIGFSQAIAEIYKPISGRVSDPDEMLIYGNPEGIRACEEYEAIVKELQETLAPELEMIQARVVQPADEMLEVVKQIRKGVTKRQHKQLDYDRHRATLKKLQDKKDRNLKDEKALYKAENDVEMATQEYDYFNNLFKEELPKLFKLVREFIQPLFQSFYYMQLNIFYTLHQRMQGCDIGYFDLTLEIEEAFEAKRGTIRDQAEALKITKFKSTGVKRPPKYGPGASKYGSKLAIEDRTSRLAITDGRADDDDDDEENERRSSSENPPPYSNNSLVVSNAGRGNGTEGTWGAAAKSKGAAPPPPKPKPSRLSGAAAVETATALYDYDAQAEGDLSFTTGDVIEIVERSASENAWWTGKISGKQGQFPANYVKLN